MLLGSLKLRTLWKSMEIGGEKNLGHDSHPSDSFCFFFILKNVQVVS